jgi:serine/threonine protein kinase
VRKLLEVDPLLCASHFTVLRFASLPVSRRCQPLAARCSAWVDGPGWPMIHRDIKPANVILTCRGGIHDFVKA